MKKFIIPFIFAILLIGCDDNFDFEDAGLSNEVIPGVYVAFNPAGAVNTLTLSEKEGSDVDVNVEIPNNVNALDNTTVTYTLGGTAVYGVNYTIAGATATGGTVVIKHKETTNADDNLADNEDIVVTILDDGVTGTDLTIEITLTSVTSSDGSEIKLGRPGPAPLTTATITISDK